MANVSDLLSGDLVTMDGSEMSGVFIAQTPHPSHPGLQLVVWILSNGEWSYDALLAGQDIGEIKPATGQERGMRLLMALKGKDYA